MDMNKGVTFDPLKNLSNNPAKSFEPFLTRDGNNVQVTWQDNTFGCDEILIKRRSTDSGNSFGPTADISNTLSRSVIPKAASSNGIVYETWIEQTANSDNLLFTKGSASLSDQERGEIVLPVS